MDRDAPWCWECIVAVQGKCFATKPIVMHWSHLIISRAETEPSAAAVANPEEGYYMALGLRDAHWLTSILPEPRFCICEFVRILAFVCQIQVITQTQDTNDDDRDPCRRKYISISVYVYLTDITWRRSLRFTDG